MEDPALKALDFASYRELLDALLPDGFCFALATAEGEPLWRDPNFPMEVIGSFVRGLEREGANNRVPSRVPWDADGGCAFVAPIWMENDRLVAAIWAAAPEDVYPVAKVKWLATVADHIAKEVSMTAELDTIASELSERYEELNLLYHTEDQVNYFAEGQEALSQLVRNCCDYLDVGLAVLVMKDKGIAIAHQSTDAGDIDTKMIAERIQESVYSTVVQHAAPLIINDAVSAESVESWQGLPYRLLATPVEDATGAVGGVLAIVNDFGKEKFANGDKNLLQVIARKATKILQVSYDTLTGLMTREGLEFLASQLLQDARSRNTSHCVLHIDFDQLHVINDTVSHEAGDSLIKAVSAYLREVTRDTDIVARIGGDELAVLLRQCPLDRGADIADKMRQGIADLAIPWQERTITITVSIGIAPIDADTNSAAAAIAAAELACGAAKEAGNNRVQRFHHGDTGLLKRHREMEAVGRIQKAIKEDQLELYAQIIVPLGADESRVHLEVLLRMNDPDGRVVAPGEFIPAAERYHLMPEIDRWVIRKLFATLDSPTLRISGRVESISVNLSGQTLNEPGFAGWLTEQLENLRFPARRICFEITETAAVANLEEATGFMRAVKAYGCEFSLDDFGSGLSSFGYLRSLPIDYLKIDGAIVKEIVDDPVAASMVAAVRQIAEVMRLKTIGEYVESEAIRQKLREIGVTYGQGYAIAKPQPLTDFFSDEATDSEAVSA